MKRKRTRSKTSFYKKLIMIIFITIAILAAYLIVPSRKPIFQTIDSTKKYADTTEEFPAIDNNDWLKPDFSSFYNKTIPGSYSKILRKAFPFFFNSKFDANEFKSLLFAVTKQHENFGYNDNFILKIPAPANSNFIIFGSLQGAFHSLIRDLEKLKEMGIINNNFEITQPNHFVIFDGDVINRSAYSLETLSIILQLMQKNPNRAFYIRGNH
jgi:hypothetical protein